MFQRSEISAQVQKFIRSVFFLPRHCPTYTACHFSSLLTAFCLGLEKTLWMLGLSYSSPHSWYQFIDQFSIAA